MATEHHPHDWITIFDQVRCELCGAQQGSRLGDAPCTVPYPEPPPQTHAHRMWRLIFTNNPADIAPLEAELEGMQAEAVDFMIEETCWSWTFPILSAAKAPQQNAARHSAPPISPIVNLSATADFFKVEQRAALHSAMS
jgi:hypothetical protein